MCLQIFSGNMLDGMFVVSKATHRWYTEAAQMSIDVLFHILAGVEDGSKTLIRNTPASNHEIISICLFLIIAVVGTSVPVTHGDSWQGLVATEANLLRQRKPNKEIKEIPNKCQDLPAHRST